MKWFAASAIVIVATAVVIAAHLSGVIRLEDKSENSKFDEFHVTFISEVI